MDVMFDFFFTCLMIHCFIYHSEAASNDEREKPVRKNSKRWTKKEMADLVFFDVMTDTGEPRHFDRIKKMWYTKYPESNKTDIALRQKIPHLRKQWQQEEEYKGYFKWDGTLEKELLDLYFNTCRHGRDSKNLLLEEWKRRHPEYRAGKRSLQVRVRKMLKEKKYPGFEPQGSSSQAKCLLRDSIGRHNWTEEERASLLKFHKLTNTGERGQFNRIGLMWHKRFPESNLTDFALRSMYRKLRRSSEKTGERGGHLNLTTEEEKELLHTYLNTRPFKDDVNITFGEAWKQQREVHQASNECLLQRARELLLENTYPEYTAQGTSEKGESSSHPSTELKEGSKAESSKSRSRKRNKFQPKMRSVKKILWGHEAAKPEKRSGKAPMVYSSDESTSSSPTMMSEDSE